MNMGETEGERLILRGIGRRRFLIGAAASAAVLASGCSGDSDGASDDVADTTRATNQQPPGTAQPEIDPEDEVVPDKDPFTLGVASGDPLADAVVLWTRLATDPVADDGLGGIPSGSVKVFWEMSKDSSFDVLERSGLNIAKDEHGFSVHADVTGLQAGTDYYYRFKVGDFTSTVGRTRTLADGEAEEFSLAVVNCQMYESGAYAAYRHLLDEEVDLVVHLGDYIYEYPGGSGEGRHSAPDRLLTTLADFRIRYASYKTDPDLAAAHARYPFFITWDDHEVANNYMGDTVPGNATAQDLLDRRAVAYKAWWEHQPVRLGPPDGPDLDIYRSLEVGSLARLYLLDQRQYAARPPCRGPENSGSDYGNCDEVEDDRTRLGEGQSKWLADELAKGKVGWNLLGNPVVLAGIDAGADESEYYLDTWDGNPVARKELIAGLFEVSNPVVLTGDYHAGMTLDVHATPFDQESPVVAPEFMAPPISSVLFPQDVTTRTPQLREQLNNHGYLRVDLSPEKLVAAFRVLDDVKDPESSISTASTWKVDSGNPVAQRA